MKAALAAVIVIGLAIGFMLPGSKAPVAQDSPAPPADARAAGKETLLERSDGGHFYTNVDINGHLVRMVVDTGASTVALTTEDARRLGIPFDPGEFTVIGLGASGEVRGKIVTIDRVSVDGKHVTQVRGAILEGLSISLLGQSYLSQIGGVQMRGDYIGLRPLSETG